MSEFKLYTVLKTFTNEELKSFHKFVNSPYHNSHPHLAEVFSVIKKFHPDYDEKLITKENLHKKLKTGTSYNYSTMKDILTKLNNLVSEFLILESLKRKNLDREFYLLEELRNRELNDLAEKQLGRIENQVNEYDGLDANYFLYLNKLEVSKYNINVLKDKALRIKTISKHIECVNNSEICLIIYLITEFISNQLNILSLINKNDLKNVSHLSEEIIKMFNIPHIQKLIDNKSRYSFFLDIYNKLLKAFINFKDVNYFIEYEKLVMNHFDKLSKDEKSLQTSNMIDYCLMKVNQNVADYNYTKKLCGLYDLYLVNQFYLTANTKYLRSNQFRDIFLLTIRAQEYDWAKSFIENYCKALEPSDIENMKNLGLAHLHCYQEHYEQTNIYLSTFNPKENIHNYDIQILTLKIFLGTKNYLPISEFIDKFLRNIKDDKVMPLKRKDKYNLFLFFFNELYRYDISDKKQNLGVVRIKLQRNKDVSDRDWLLEMFDKRIEKPVESEILMKRIVSK